MKLVLGVLVGVLLVACSDPTPSPSDTTAPTSTGISVVASPSNAPANASRSPAGASPTATIQPTPTPWSTGLPSSKTPPAKVRTNVAEITQYIEGHPWLVVRYATLINVVPDVKHGRIWLVLRAQGARVSRFIAWSCADAATHRRCPGAQPVYATYQGVTLWMAITKSTVVVNRSTRIGRGLDLAAAEIRARFKIGDRIPQVSADPGAGSPITKGEVSMTVAGIDRMEALVGVRLDPAKRRISLHCDGIVVVDYAS